MSIRTGAWCFAGILVMATAVGAEPPKTTENVGDLIREAIRSEATPALVEKVVAKDPEVAGYPKLLAGHPKEVAALVHEALGEAKALWQRDDTKADAFAGWLTAVAEACHKQAPKDVSACRALGEAQLLRARTAVGLAHPIGVAVWIKAADMTAAAGLLSHEPSTAAAAHVAALAVLHEGARAEGAPIGPLMAAAATLCKRTLKLNRRAVSEDTRRAVVASYKAQVAALQDVSRKGAQKALQAFFGAFAPIAQASGASKADMRAWNVELNVARRLKVADKVEYISRRGAGADGLVTYQLPRTGRWKGTGSQIIELFEGQSLFRYLRFHTYSWKVIYGDADSPRTVGGDNVKGVAGRSFDRFLRSLADDGSKVTKKRAPKRSKINKNVGSGIGYTIEYIDEKGRPTRVRSYFFKAVKAEHTVEIIIVGSMALSEYDPEYEAVLKSLDFTKKKR